MSDAEHLSELLNYCRREFLSSSDAAMLLLALSQYNQVSPECDYLVSRVRGQNSSWVKKGKLSTVVLRLLALQNYNKTELTGSMLALLGKRLIEAEVRVGGPYHAPGNNDIELNALVAQLFELLGSPLVSLNDYLKEVILAYPEYLSTNFGAWSISKPVKLELDLEVPANKVRPTSLKHRVAAILLSAEAHPLRDKILYEPGEATIAYIKSEIEAMPSIIRPVALGLWKTVVDVDQSYEITCLSRYFALSIKDPPAELSGTFFQVMGVANFYAWVAYTIYDDFIDGEGDEALLPVANIFHRLSLFRYLEFANQDFVKKFYDDVDLANAYELSNYRATVHNGIIEFTQIPEYGDREFLAQRSRGHILGPLLIATYIKDSLGLEQELIKKALDNYLIARQLNDDVHDWVEDLRNGQLSFVIAHLLTMAHIEPGQYRLDDLTRILRKYFWERGLNEICELTITHATLAKNYLEKSELVRINSPFVENFIDPIAKSARGAIRQLKEQKDFVKAYQDD